jgi:transcriptional regulator with XRE-family HTH domain
MGCVPNPRGVAKKIGEVLRAARLEAGLSIRDAERLCGLPAGTISQIETGVRADPGFSSIARIAKAIGLSLDDLVRRAEGRASGAASSKKGVATALAEIAKLRAESERAVDRLDRAATALGVATVRRVGRKKKP